MLDSLAKVSVARKPDHWPWIAAFGYRGTKFNLVTLEVKSGWAVRTTA